MTRPAMNDETTAAYLWLSRTGNVEDAVNIIVREVSAHAHYADKVGEIADQIKTLVHDAFPAIVRPGEPEDQREVMRAALVRVDWQEIALLFIEHEAWRAEGRRLRHKRAILRQRRKR